MGIASNQARLMTLCSRQHDLELRAQNISAQKMIKAMQSQEMATQYSDALNNYSLLKNAESTMKNGDGMDVFIVQKDGSFNEYDGVHQTGFDGSNGFYRKNLFQAVRLMVASDSNAADAKAYLDQEQAEYDAETAKLSAEEKRLDMELTQINTEHSAVTTEYDSIKSLISDNTDKSFNIFS